MPVGMRKERLARDPGRKMLRLYEKLLGLRSSFDGDNFSRGVLSACGGEALTWMLERE